MKKLCMALVTLMVIYSCQNLENNDAALVASGRDQNGCVNSAGFKWSQLRHSCIQFYGEGVKLLPTNSKSKSNAYLVFNEDSTKVELFLRGSESIVLSKSGQENFLALSYKLNTDGLYYKDKLVYVQH